MYTLHSYVLAVVAVGLAIAHLTSLLIQEREIKQELDFQSEQTRLAEIDSESGVTA